MLLNTPSISTGTSLNRSTPLLGHPLTAPRFQERSMNGRPRKTLGYMMPEEKPAELVALTG